MNIVSVKVVIEQIKSFANDFTTQKDGWLYSFTKDSELYYKEAKGSMLKMIHAGSSEIAQGSGNKFDADTVDGKHASSFFDEKNFSGDIDNVIEAGVYSPSGATNYPGTRSQFMLIVGVSGGFIHQQLTNDTTIFIRRSVDGGANWSVWV